MSYKSPSEIPTTRLTHEYWEKSKELSKAEREWAIVDHQRLPVLAEIEGWFEGVSHAEAERQARTTKEYQEFLTKRADIKQQLHIARAKVDGIDYEIRMRLNKSYTDRQEQKAGNLVT